ncbi:MAG TPA: (Fe-S)-binding protein [Stellaceae bacterium]|jgi:Fe-S oxidoreductase|nr:(Fe-S)-binding protein [Stellaceae bacterium]
MDAMDGGETQGFLDLFHTRGAAIADACTRCGDCFRACPMTEPGGIAAADPSATAAGIVDLITGGSGTEDALRWTEICSGSGYCIPACQHGINPRFMVQMARGFARRARDGAPLETRWRKQFQGVSRGVRVLSRLQLPPETLARFRPSPAARATPPDIVFYTGCNVLKTPHIALLALDVLDKLGVSYEVMGGIGQCCGVYQFREGDFANNVKMANATIEGLASAGTSTVLSWCPSCQLTIGETTLPNYEAQFGEKPFDLNPFFVFLADRIDELAGLMTNRVEQRVALHERPVFPQTMEAVRNIARAIPGLELVELDVPRVGVQANTVLPKLKKELLDREFQAAFDAGVTTLATIYHADHREICDAATGRSFEIVNFMELLGQALGIDSDDAYKRLKQLRDIDDIIVETAPLIEANRLDLDTVRDALAAEFGG